MLFATDSEAELPLTLKSNDTTPLGAQRYCLLTRGSLDADEVAAYEPLSLLSELTAGIRPFALFSKRQDWPERRRGRALYSSETVYTNLLV